MGGALGGTLERRGVRASSFDHRRGGGRRAVEATRWKRDRQAGEGGAAGLGRGRPQRNREFARRRVTLADRRRGIRNRRAHLPFRGCATGWAVVENASERAHRV